MGVYVPKSRINNIVYGSPISDPGGVAFVGQSGWVTENVVVLGRERGLRFSKIVSIGNQSDLTIEDMIEYLAEDRDTRVIAVYAEGVKRGREFFDTAKKAGKKKPLIVWKSGRSIVGARSASSHTGSLAGDSAVFDALAQQTGMVQARDLDDLMDLMVGFSCPVYPEGKRIALLCESGGGAVSGGDAAEKYGLELPTLSTGAQKKLVEILTGRVPPFAPPRNPVDLVWGPTDDPAGLFTSCGRVMLSETDAAVMLNYQKFDEALSRKMTDLRDETGKPIFIVPGYVTMNRGGMAALTAVGLPCFDTPGKATRVLSQVVRYALRVRYH
jgi:acyl-CoA synthetase (NDP forming)